MRDVIEGYAGICFNLKWLPKWRAGILDIQEPVDPSPIPSLCGYLTTQRYGWISVCTSNPSVSAANPQERIPQTVIDCRNRTMQRQTVRLVIYYIE